MPRIRKRRKGDDHPDQSFDRPEPKRVVRRRKVSPGVVTVPEPKSVADKERAQMSLQGFLSHSAQTNVGKRKRETLNKIDALVRDAEMLAVSGEWEGQPGRIFVGLYALCFRLAYGEIPVELYRSEGLIAIGARNASLALRKHFGGSASKLVEFMKWCWENEEGKIAWAKRNGVSRRPLGLRFQFSDTLIQEYRIMGVSRGKRRR